MLNFTPMTDKEISELNLWPEGWYRYESGLATLHTNPNNGNISIKVPGYVYSENKKMMLTVYLSPAFPKTFKHFCLMAGLLAEYESGNLLADKCSDKKGFAKVKRQEAQGNYDARNQIVDFSSSMQGPGQGPTIFSLNTPLNKDVSIKTGEMIDDDLPF